MDFNVTLGIPAAALMLGFNGVVNYLKLRDSRNGNGKHDAILADLKEGQKQCAQCFKHIGENEAKNGIHLQNIVSQLQNLNNKI